MVRTSIAIFTGEIQRFLNRKTNIVKKCKIVSCLIKDFLLKKKTMVRKNSFVMNIQDSYDPFVYFTAKL